MISNGEKQWYYLAVKTLSALLRGITSKHYGDFYCLNCLHYFRTKNKVELHKKVCQKKDFCNVIMPSEDAKILEFNQYQKSDKAPFIIYAVLQCIIENIDGCNLILRINHLMLPYCLNCRKNTESKNPKVARSKNKVIMVLSKCAVCDSKKSKLIKQKEDSGLLNSLGIKTPLSKITFLGPLLF